MNNIMLNILQSTNKKVISDLDTFYLHYLESALIMTKYKFIHETVLDVLRKKHEVLLSEHEVLLSEHEVLLSEHEVLLSEHNVLLSEHNILLSEHDTLTQKYDDVQNRLLMIRKHPFKVVLKKILRGIKKNDKR